MLELKINNENVDLFPDASISIDEESPVFEKDSIPGGYSYPFSLPITPRNRRILGFPERLEKNGVMSTEKPFQLFHDGILRTAGSITVTEAGVQYKANLMIGSGDLARKIKDLKLKDLDLGGTRTWEWKTEYEYPVDDFALFPIYNPELLTGTSYATSYALNKYRLNSFENAAYYQDEENVFAVSIMPFLGYVVRRLMGQFGFQVTANVLESNKDFRDLVIYTNRDITEVETTTEEQEVVMGVNQYGEMEYETILVSVATRTVSTFDLVNSLPDMLISDFLLSLRSLLNIAFVFDAQDHVSIIQRQDLLLNTEINEITSHAVGTPSITAPAPLSGIKLAWEHDEDDTLFAEGFQKIDDQLSLIKDPVANISELAAVTPGINDIRLVESMDAYYQYAYDEDLSRYQWAKWSIGFQNYLEGLMQEIFETKFSTLLMVTYQRLTGGPFIRVPWTEQLCNSIERDSYQPFSPRLLFYRGMQLDSESDAYPMGSNDNLDRTGTQLTGKNLCLKWEGEFGIYEQLYKKYISWWIARKQVTWTIKDPSSLRFDRKYAIDGKHFLLKKRTINLTQKGIEPGECEFYLV